MQDRTLPIYPIVFHHPGLPVGGKHMQRIAAMEASEQTGSEITDSTQPKKPQHPSKNLYERGHIKMRYQHIINQ